MAGIGAASLALTGNNVLAGTPQKISLIAGAGKASLLGPAGNKTDIWAYNGSAPGPLLRFKQGETARISFRNNLSEASTIHWHGLRIRNDMDGVPFLTQPPVQSGQEFLYEFKLKDAGTYWYHPHVNSAVQVGRGLSGALIIDEPDAPVRDRDVVWVLDDWHLQKTGDIAPFGSLHNAAHGGRFGNVITINGSAGDDETGELFNVRSRERIRLRLINVANARIFGLRFEGHNPWRITIDGHPVRPHQIGQGLVIIPPGGRVDLMIDMQASPGKIFRIRDEYYRRSAYTLALMSYSKDRAARAKLLPPPKMIGANPVAVPNLSKAKRIEMNFQGGAMGGLRSALYKGKEMGLRELASMGMVWAVNGEVIPAMEEGNLGKPMAEIKLGETIIFSWRNETAFDHPIHLHGHSFHVIARSGKKLTPPIVMDTVLIRPREYVDVAFVADNLGDWALHCHVLEHASSGMMGYVRVI
jgi:FtsP/CotA-like multicopper oxidase with cupredoxin domain